MTSALVTGAAGFIGSHLSARLVAEECRVLGVDDFSPHYERALKELNVASLRRRETLRAARGRSRADRRGAAARRHRRRLPPGGAARSARLVERVRRLRARERQRDARTASTPARRPACGSCSPPPPRVYGNSAELPAAERTALRPVSPYGATKAMTELLAGAYGASLGLEAVGLRYFTVYGPRQRPDMGLARFVEAATAGEPLPDLRRRAAATRHDLRRRRRRRDRRGGAPRPVRERLQRRLRRAPPRCSSPRRAPGGPRHGAADRARGAQGRRRARHLGRHRARPCASWATRRARSCAPAWRLQVAEASRRRAALAVADGPPRDPCHRRDRLQPQPRPQPLPGAG